MIHSAGVLHRGDGYLFVGRPGSGKSTVAKLSLPDTVLNDEMNLISFSKKGVDVTSTPFNGLFMEKSAGCGRLNAVLLLKQGSEHKLTKTNDAEAVKVLIREIVPPIGLDEVITPAVRAAMLDIAVRIQRSVPVYWLEFQRNRSFWELLDQEIILTEEGEELHTLDETGTFVWKAIDGKKSLSRILDLICLECEVTHEGARDDLIVFLEALKGKGIISFL